MNNILNIWLGFRALDHLLAKPMTLQIAARHLQIHGPDFLQTLKNEPRLALTEEDLKILAQGLQPDQPDQPQ